MVTYIIQVNSISLCDVYLFYLIVKFVRQIPYWSIRMSTKAIMAA